MRRRLQSFVDAGRGVWQVFRTQANARIHAGAVVAVVALGLWLRIDGGEWALLVLSMTGVLAAEAINTAVEYLVDLVSPEHRQLAGWAKDAAAGAVLLAAIGAAVVGGLVLGPRLLSAFSA